MIAQSDPHKSLMVDKAHPQVLGITTGYDANIVRS
jgi:hypothetical protein